MTSPVDLNGKLSLHPGFVSTVTRVGHESAPVIVVDNFLKHPDVVVEYAALCSTFEGVSDTFYPGVRAPLPSIYCFAVRAFLGELVADTFDLRRSAVAGELGHLSLVTTRPAQLGVLQRMPHIDSSSPKQLAVLHYLCERAHGGTSFYRHRRTGFETIGPGRAQAYQQALVEDLNHFGAPPAGYLCGDDAMFDRIAGFEAAFNRVLIYRSYSLHSADIPADFHFGADPRTGRLTANTFFYYR
jgi:hypothetical protein